MPSSSQNPRTVTVKGLTIGEGRPKIIVPITAKSGQAALESAARLAGMAAIDLIEFRVDHLANALDAQDVARLCAAVAGALRGKPMMVTFRTQAEGGITPVSGPAYADFYAAILQGGQADLIDLEFNRGADTVRPVLAAARAAGVATVVSYHDFHATAPAHELVGLMRQMQEWDADIVKVATMPASAGDVLRLLTATWDMKANHADRPLITMAMNGVGVVSRLAGEVFGSAATFGMVGEASAPGQIPVEDLLSVLEVIHRSA
jgi:3-dehydroquinate dehydratase-1